MRLSSDHDQDLLARTRQFALRIIHLSTKMPKGPEARVIRDQVLRSGTSVGAHLAEAAFAKSRRDFCSKIDGALGELEETRYWLSLVVEGGFVSATRLRLLNGESDELKAILITIAHRSKSKEA